jgi:LmbE family N-acetylglucosaminyl deacetylase
MLAKPNRNFEAFEASKVLGAKPPAFLDYRDQMLDTLPLLEITKMIEVHLFIVKPTIVYTHHAGDLNLDHRIVHEAVMTACRPLPASQVKAIYAFEIPSSTEWGPRAFNPDHFVSIDCMAGEKTALGKKFSALQCYGAEMRNSPHPRSYDSVQAMTVLRGSQCGVHGAEAFMTLRSIVR